MFTPHLPPKLLNFIPRTNKSIFIAAGGAGSGLLFHIFLFFKVLLNLPGSGGRPHGPSMRVSYGVSFFTTAAQTFPPSSRRGGSCQTCHWPSDDPPFTGKQGGEASGSLLCVWHFIVFQTLPTHFLPTPSLAISQERKPQLRKALGFARGQENPSPPLQLCGPVGLSHLTV